jgi:hypothetical protein
MNEPPRLFVAGSTALQPVPGEDELLANLEARAAELDAMARARTPSSVADESARRRVLLLDLEGYGLLEPSNATRKLTWLGRWSLPLLADYRRAAELLRRYLDSPERARRVNATGAPSLVGAPVSLDWFRLRHDDPGDEASFARLAELEAAARPATLVGGEGDLFVPLDGRMYKVHWRMDDGSHAALVSATALQNR